jgi:hypothetical protein
VDATPGLSLYEREGVLRAACQGRIGAFDGPALEAPNGRRSPLETLADVPSWHDFDHDADLLSLAGTDLHGRVAVKPAMQLCSYAVPGCAVRSETQNSEVGPARWTMVSVLLSSHESDRDPNPSAAA